MAVNVLVLIARYEGRGCTENEVANARSALQDALCMTDDSHYTLYLEGACSEAARSSLFTTYA